MPKKTTKKKTVKRKPTAPKKVAGKKSPKQRSSAAARPARVVPKSDAKRGRKGTAAHPAVALPPAHRAVFIDAENTSSEADLERVIEYLKVDRRAQPTTIIAAGNWRAIGSGSARLLARSGAELVHSAPSPGVRDWSDLWIAVAAGRWLAQAKPGDRLEIVSDDRAFDAVIQAAAALGVDFQRISYRNIPGVATTHAAPAHAEADRRPRRRGGRRRRRGSATPATGTSTQHAAVAPAVQREPAATRAAAASEAANTEPHGATHEQVRETLARLVGGNSQKWVNMDLLANALRNEGFNRPPGSPRLVTRLRYIKGIEVSPSGMVRLRNENDEATTPEPATEAATGSEEGTDDATETPRPRRRRRRGRGGSKTKATAEAEEPTAEQQ